MAIGGATAMKRSRMTKDSRRVRHQCWICNVMFGMCQMSMCAESAHILPKHKHVAHTHTQTNYTHIHTHIGTDVRQLTATGQHGSAVRQNPETIFRNSNMICEL